MCSQGIKHYACGEWWHFPQCCVKAVNPLHICLHIIYRMWIISWCVLNPVSQLHLEIIGIEEVSIIIDSVGQIMLKFYPIWLYHAIIPKTWPLCSNYANYFWLSFIRFHQCFPAILYNNTVGGEWYTRSKIKWGNKACICWYSQWGCMVSYINA